MPDKKPAHYVCTTGKTATLTRLPLLCLQWAPADKLQEILEMFASLPVQEEVRLWSWLIGFFLMLLLLPLSAANVCQGVSSSVLARGGGSHELGTHAFSALRNTHNCSFEPQDRTACCSGASIVPADCTLPRAILAAGVLHDRLPRQLGGALHALRRPQL